jgi:hypothetical protein
MPASPTLDKAPVHTDACEHTMWCVDSGSERLAVWLPGTRALHHPGCSGDASLGRALLLLCLPARMAGQEVCNMCFLLECNVCASVRIFLQRNSFDQSHTERRARKGGCDVAACQPGVARGHLVAGQGRAEGMPGLTYTPRQHRLRGKERCSWVVVRATRLSDAAAHGGVSGPVRAVVKRLGTLSRSVEGVPTG